jgi:hypothetical protein
MATKAATPQPMNLNEIHPEYARLTNAVAWLVAVSWQRVGGAAAPLAKRRRPLIARLWVRPGEQRHVRPNRTTETTLGVHPTAATKLAR